MPQRLLTESLCRQLAFCRGGRRLQAELGEKE